MKIRIAPILTAEAQIGCASRCDVRCPFLYGVAQTTGNAADKTPDARCLLFGKLRVVRARPPHDGIVYVHRAKRCRATEVK